MNRFGLVAFASLYALAVMACPDALGQSLREKLLSEEPSQLVQQALQSGDYARGAILFTSPRLACAQCHTKEASAVGPDLSQIPNKSRDTYLVESLLEPSKVIRQGFTATTVVTLDGRTVIGRRLQDAEDEIELRLPSGSFDKVRIKKTDIELIRENPTSMMPEKLVDELTSRQDFIDLLRYLIELAPEVVIDSATQRSFQKILPKHLQGALLLSDHNCLRCHAGSNVIPHPLENSAPLIHRSITLLKHEWLTSYLFDVHRASPHSRMPDVLGSLPEEHRRLAVDDLVTFLRSFAEAPPTITTDYAYSTERGETLFHSVGCVACHNPRNPSGEELALADSIPLMGIQYKYTFPGLVSFLEKPLDYRPSGRMPHLNLSHWEAQDIASYLLEKQDGEDEPIMPTHIASDEARIERGRTIFSQTGCANCHATPTAGKLRLATSLSKLRLSKGCLSESPTNTSPVFSLDNFEREAISEFIEKARNDAGIHALASAEILSLSLHSMRCIQCHQRDGFGGVTGAREPYFQSENQNLGPQGRIPPTLDSVGAKLKPTWLRKVLVEGKAIRPYIKTRMPQFGSENVHHLVDLFEELDHLPAIEQALVDDDKLFRESGWKMVGSEGMNCIACHTYQLKSAANMSAVDLTEMTERLEKDWFYRFLKAPQSLVAGTVMPTFWPDGKSTRPEFFEGHTEKQIEAIWHYLSEGRQARQPRGLVIEPMELLAGKEAVMLRRSYPEIGKRGIGVGFPSGVNIVFDAEQMRLGLLWKGRFADPGGVWRSQGHGNVRPLGEKLVRFDPGPDFDSRDNPWIIDDGRPPLHQFKGYRLDVKRRPTFFYEYANVKVEDAFVDGIRAEDGQPCLRRTIKFHKPRGTSPVRLRIGSGKLIEPTSAGTFTVDQELTIHFMHDYPHKLIRSGETTALVVLPDEKDQNPHSVVVEYSW